MKILDKYITIKFTTSLLYCIITFIFLYIIADLFGHLDEIIKQQVKTTVLFRYYAALIPAILVQTSPLATLLSTIYTISNLSNYNEIIAMRSSGISKFRIILPLLFIGLFISIVTLFINEQIVPNSSIVAEKIKKQSIENKIADKNNIILTDLTLYGNNNRLFYVKNYDTYQQIMWDVTVLQHNKEQKLISKITSKWCQWKDDKWIFYDCMIYQVDNSGSIVGNPIVFKKKIMPFDETPFDFTLVKSTTDIMSSRDLNSYITRLKQNNTGIINKLRISMYQKIAYPFINIVIILVAMPLVFGNRRSGTLMGLGMSILIGLVFYGVMDISIALGHGGIFPPLLSVWITHLIFLIIGIGLFLKKQ